MWPITRARRLAPPSPRFAVLADLSHSGTPPFLRHPDGSLWPACAFGHSLPRDRLPKGCENRQARRPKASRRGEREESWPCRCATSGEHLQSRKNGGASRPCAVIGHIGFEIDRLTIVKLVRQLVD